MSSTCNNWSEDSRFPKKINCLPSSKYTTWDYYNNFFYLYFFSVASCVLAVRQNVELHKSTLFAIFSTTIVAAIGKIQYYYRCAFCRIVNDRGRCKFRIIWIIPLWRDRPTRNVQIMLWSRSREHYARTTCLRAK